MGNVIVNSGADRVLIVYEADDSPLNFYYLAPAGMGVTEAVDAADAAVREYDESFDFDEADMEYQPYNHLASCGFDLMQSVVMEEKW